MEKSHEIKENHGNSWKLTGKLEKSAENMENPRKSWIIMPNPRKFWKLTEIHGKSGKTWKVS